MTCPICRSASSGGISLSNGTIVHQACYTPLVQEWEDVKLLIDQTRSSIAEKQIEAAASQSIVNMISRLFGGGRSGAQLVGELMILKNVLIINEERYTAACSKVIPLFDRMLVYPPDWTTRVEYVKNRDARCTSCGGSKFLQVHHILPLSKGGSNHFSNLCLLCESCHQNAHGGRLFNYVNSTNTAPAISDRVQVIHAAINQGRLVEFLYKKPTDQNFRKRKIKPLKITEYEHSANHDATLCVEGFCYSRNAERVFALKRMKNLKQLD